MKGLLLKDLYMLWKHAKISLFMVLAFCVAGCLYEEAVFFLAFPFLISGMLPMTLMAYDEAYRWDAYAQTLPCTRAQLVLSKYLTGLFVSCPAALLVLVLSSIKDLAQPSFSVASSSILAAGLFALALIPASFLLPLLFKLGVQKGRLAYYLILGMGCGAITLFAGKGAQLSSGSAGGIGVSVLILAASIVLYALSYSISVAIYEKREF